MERYWLKLHLLKLVFVRLSHSHVGSGPGTQEICDFLLLMLLQEHMVLARVVKQELTSSLCGVFPE